jgi:hypothetical protein
MSSIKIASQVPLIFCLLSLSSKAHWGGLIKPGHEKQKKTLYIVQYSANNLCLYSILDSSCILSEVHSSVAESQ